MSYLTRRTLVIILLFSLAAALPSWAHHIKPGATRTMPVTTSSPKARDLFERALTDYENLYLERANIGWRAAVAADPDFALAYAFIAYNSRDPEEARAAREKAKALTAKVTPGEQPADPVDHQRAGKQFPGRNPGDERHAGDVSQRQAPGLSGGKLDDGTEQLRAGAERLWSGRWPSTRIIRRP